MYGFQHGCRPLLFLDSIPLKSKYQGTLLAATAPDGDDGVFPVAFAVVDAETDDDWHWFLLQLKSALATAQSITFVADREKGLKDSIADIFGDVDVHHGYCLRYLSEQLIRDLKGQFSHEVKRFMIEDFYAAMHRGLKASRGVLKALKVFCLRLTIGACKVSLHTGQMHTSKVPDITI